MTPCRTCRLIGLVLLLVGLSMIQTSYAQDNPIYEAGFKPYGSFEAGDIDSVNLLNGALNLNIPLVDYPQRGGALHLGFRIQYTNAIYEWTYFSCQENGGPYCYDFVGPGKLISITPDFTMQLQYPTSGGGNPLAVITPDGASHTVLDSSHNKFAYDGSAIETTATSDETSCPTTEWATDRTGVEYVRGCTTNTGPAYEYYEDPNGNRITSNLDDGGIGYAESWSDTLGRTVNRPPVYDDPDYAPTTNFTGCTGTLTTLTAYQWTIPAPNGQTNTYKICYATIYAQLPSSVCSPFPDNCGGGGSGAAIQSIVLPNGTAWTFTYDSANPNNPNSVGYGDLIQVTFPTGGTISYTWQSFTPSQQCYTGSDGYSFSREVATRAVNANDGTGTHTWTYTYQNQNGTPPNVPPSYTTVLDSLGNQSVHTFTDLGGTGCSFYETQAQYYQGTNTLLQTVTTGYISTTGVVNGAPALANQITTTWANGQTSMVKRTFEYPVSASGYGNLTDGNVTVNQEYDYGGSLIRTTTTSYMISANATYLTNNLFNLPSTVKVTDNGGTQRAYTTYGYDESSLVSSGVTVGRDPSAPPDGTYRGNQTSVHSWLNTNNSYLVSDATYFDTGMVSVGKDAKGNPTTSQYSSTYYGAYPTTVTNALSQPTKYTYDLNSGLVTSVEDANNQTTSMTYDNFTWRNLTTTYPDGGLLTYCYSDISGGECSSGLPYQFTATQKLTSSANSVLTGIVDGLGRPSETLLSDPSCSTGDRVDYGYDGNGNLASVSNAYCTTGDPTYGETSYKYDALARTTQITDADGATQTFSYNGNCETVSDEAGVSHEYCSDGLGRMTEAVENPSGLDFVTNYSFDVLNDLTGVVQNGSRQRTYLYDSLGRLTSSTDPEANWSTSNQTYVATAFSYDANGNVISRTTPAPNQQGSATVTTTYSYDSLNRITQRSYSDGVTPTASFLYDQTSVDGFTFYNPVGRLVKESTNGTFPTANYYSYDSMGRILVRGECVYINNCGTSSPTIWETVNTYDFAGDLTSFTDSDGNTFTQTFNSAHRATQLTSSWVDSNHPATLASTDPSIGYFPGGAVRKMTFGNNLIQTNVLNNRLQPCRIATNSNGTPPASCSDTNMGNVQDFSVKYNWGTTDNGNVVSWAAEGNQIFARTYTYDALNRLSTMAQSSGSGQSCSSAFGLSWSIDAWGNRIQQNVTNGTCNSFNQPVNAQNQFSSGSYDTAGNLLGDGVHSYSYDSENRVNYVNGGNVALYVYDAESRRVAKGASGVITYYVYGADGNVISEFNQSGDWTQTHIHFNGQLTAFYSGVSTGFYHNDHLGSTRLVTLLNGSVYDNMDYLPFGEQIAGGAATPFKFTGKEEDSETTLNYFGDRYYSSQLGRFMTPDPAGLAAVSLADPQTWNRYDYVRNSPLAAVDPRGLWCVWQDGTHDDDESDGGIDPNGCLAQGGLWDPTDTLVGCDTSWNCTTSTGATVLGCSNDKESCIWQPGGSIVVNGKANAMSAVCSLLPQGQILSIGGGTGMMGSVPGSLNLTTNYNTGMTSLSFTGGLQGGWNNGATGYAGAGYVFSTSTFTNSDISGVFWTASGSSPAGPGGYVSWSPDGQTTVVGITNSRSLIPLPSVGISKNWTTHQYFNGFALTALTYGILPSTLTNTLVTIVCNGG